MEDSKLISIYIIWCEASGKYYIGQTRNMTQRIRKHKCEGYALHSAIKKYGADKFWYAYEYTGITSQESANKLEKETIEKYNSLVPNGYNIALGGDAHWQSPEVRKKISEALKGKKHSEETKRKISDTKKRHPHHKPCSQDTRQKISKANTGKKKPWSISEERRQEIFEKRKGRVHSQEWNQNIGASLSKMILCIEENLIFSSATSAKRWLNSQGKKGDPQAAASGKQITAGGYHWTYVVKDQTN